MKKNKDHFMVACHPLKQLIAVKKLSQVQIKVIHSAISSIFEEMHGNIPIEDYFSNLFDVFLVDPGKTLRDLPKVEKDASLDIQTIQEDERESYLYSIYSAIAVVYGEFTVEIFFGDPVASGESRIDLPIPTPDSVVVNPEIVEGKESMEDIFSEFQPGFGEEGFSLGKISTRKDINQVEKYLKKQVIGQEEAVKSLIDSLSVSVAGIGKKKHTVLAFLGPTGVGKSQLAKSFSHRVLPKDRVVKINCGEFVGGHEIARLLGPPPGYVGHQDKSYLKECADKSNQWVFLIDEVEKAHPKVFNAILNLLDEGRITDNNNCDLDFTESYIILTSNQGMSELKLGKDMSFAGEGKTYENSKEEISKSLENNFAPEFLGRIDNIVMFNQLTEKNLKSIIKTQLKALPIKPLQGLINFVYQGIDKKYGARDVRNFLAKFIEPVIANAMLDGLRPLSGEFVYTPSVKAKEFTIIDTYNVKDLERDINTSGN